MSILLKIKELIWETMSSKPWVHIIWWVQIPGIFWPNACSWQCVFVTSCSWRIHISWQFKNHRDKSSCWWRNLRFVTPRHEIKPYVHDNLYVRWTDIKQSMKIKMNLWNSELWYKINQMSDGPSVKHNFYGALMADIKNTIKRTSVVSI